MSWGPVQGHDRVVEQFRRALQQGRLASTFLFVGPEGIGKRTFALRLAEALLCEAQPEHQLDPCGHCPGCQQVQAQSHPDLELVSKPRDRSFIPLESFIGDRDHRMREGLCYRISLKPNRGWRKVALIDDADYLNPESANCLLKTLEEPPPGSVLILIGTSEQKQLPTIRSRCQTIRFRPLAEELVAELLVSHKLVPDLQRAAQLAAISGGSLQRALELDDPALGEFRQVLFNELAQDDFNSVEFSKTVGAFVDQAGKEAPPRRARMNLLLGMAAEFYRQRMFEFSGTVGGGDAETAAACLERCLDALYHVQANANQATLLECWLDDLAQIISRPADSPAAAGQRTGPGG